MNLSLERTNFTQAGGIIIPEIFYRRIKTGLAEMDLGFGGGLLPGSSITITAKAGSGKTTFLLQLFQSLAHNNYNVAYASGEENLYQLAFNCKRLNTTSVNIANETDVDRLVACTELYDALVVDSFQALTTTHNLAPKEHETYAINKLVTAAKNNECVIFFVMHLTKAGVLKGSSLIPHIVDVNMEINVDESGDEFGRVISIVKNRFGPCKDFTSILTEQGFVFTKQELNHEERTKSKKDRNADNRDKILEMEGEITKQRVIREVNVTPAQAYVLLRDLCEYGKLIKVGRGEEAYFEKVE